MARAEGTAARVFKSKTRDEWCSIMEHTDVCFAPVLTMGEAAEHPHIIARDMFIERNGARAAGPGAALQPHASPRSRARRSTPARAP